MDTLIIGPLRLELLAPSGSEAVETDFPIGFRDAPFGSGPTLEEKFLQRRIKRSFFYLQHFGREAMNPLGNGVAVEGSRAKNSEDQKDEGARRHLSIRHNGIMGSIEAPDTPCQVRRRARMLAVFEAADSDRYASDSTTGCECLGGTQAAHDLGATSRVVAGVPTVDRRGPGLDGTMREQGVV